MLVVGAAILWLADAGRPRAKLALDLPPATAFGIGAAQALALIPGISRSGISISAGLFAGLEREEAARFSFLMATPITAAAAAYEVLQARPRPGAPVEVGPLVVGWSPSFLFGVLAISFLLRYLRTHSHGRLRRLPDRAGDRRPGRLAGVIAGRSAATGAYSARWR